jgi:hypothetical protein
MNKKYKFFQMYGWNSEVSNGLNFRKNGLQKVLNIDRISNPKYEERQGKL